MADRTAPGWREQAYSEYQKKRAALVRRQSELARQIEPLQKERSSIEDEVSELDRAASVFGLLGKQKHPLGTIGRIPPADGEAEGEDGVLFKDIALEALAKAYPTPLRAAKIREIAGEKLGKEFHPKTAGMTLYRLSKFGIVRNEGWDWYWVPEDERKALEGTK